MYEYMILIPSISLRIYHTCEQEKPWNSLKFVKNLESLKQLYLEPEPINVILNAGQIVNK